MVRALRPPLQDIFALQDEIVQKIVTTLKLQLTLREQGMSGAQPRTTWKPMTLYLRGLESYLVLFTTKKEANDQARQMFERAIELDPQYAEAYTGWAGPT